MKITFICPFFGLNGGNRVVATYARHLHARGHEVTIVSKAGHTPSFRNRIKDKLGLNSLKAKPVMPLTAALQDRHIVIPGAGAPTAGDLPDADIIVATFYNTAEWVAALPASKGRKFYLLQDYEVFPYLPIDRVIASYDLPLKKIAVSKYIIDEISKNHAVSGIEMVPNAVDLEQFSAPPRKRNTSLTVGFLYTTAPRKNVALAIDAITLAKIRLPDLQVKVFGSRPPEDTLPLPAWVNYHQAPPQSFISEIYAACDAWLFTSEKEGFGLPILEAMACRTPVLATCAGAAPDLINGSNGKLLPLSAQAFATEIQRFARMSKTEWQGYSEAAYSTATSYAWEDVTDRLLDIFTNETGASIPLQSETSVPGTRTRMNRLSRHATSCFRDEGLNDHKKGTET